MKKLLLLFTLAGCQTITPIEPPTEPIKPATISIVRPTAPPVTDADEEEETTDEPDEVEEPDAESETAIAKPNKFRWRYIVKIECGDAARRKFRYYVSSGTIDSSSVTRTYYVLTKYWQKERTKIFDKTKNYQIQSYDYTAKHWAILATWQGGTLELKPGKSAASMPVTVSVFDAQCQ